MNDKGLEWFPRGKKQTDVNAETPPRQMESDLNSLRVKVAKLLGIKPTTECPECYGTGYGGSEMDHIPCDECRTTGKVKSYYVSPNYPSDLNACAEMLNTLLSDGSWSRYRTEIEKVCHTLGQPSGTAWFLEHNATAEQRCRAFVAVMVGKQ